MQTVTTASGLLVPNPWQEKQGNLKIRWRYNGEEGEYIDKDQYYYKNSLTGEIDCFIWTEGNYGCDCNRSGFFGLGPKYPDKCKGDDGNGFPDHFICGHTIEVLSIIEA